MPASRSRCPFDASHGSARYLGGERRRRDRRRFRRSTAAWNQGTGGVALVADEKSASWTTSGGHEGPRRDIGARQDHHRPRRRKDRVSVRGRRPPDSGIGFGDARGRRHRPVRTGARWVFSTDEFASDPQVSVSRGDGDASRSPSAPDSAARRRYRRLPQEGAVAIGGDGVIDDARPATGFATRHIARAVGTKPRQADRNVRPGDSSTIGLDDSNPPRVPRSRRAGGKADLARTGFAAGGMIAVALGCLAAGAVLMRRHED